jgi:hypothetical protein
MVSRESITPTKFKYEWTTKFDETVASGDTDSEKAISWYLVAGVPKVSFRPGQRIISFCSHFQICLSYVESLCPMRL